MKIILAAVNAKYIHSNLAVYSLRAFAKAYVSETKILEYTINQQMDEILMDLYREKPDLLCFSCYIWNLDYVEELAREIKKILPETILWLGGPEVSYDAVDVLTRLRQVTGVMKGRARRPFWNFWNITMADGKHWRRLLELRFVQRMERSGKTNGGTLWI